MIKIRPTQAILPAANPDSKLKPSKDPQIFGSRRIHKLKKEAVKKRNANKVMVGMLFVSLVSNYVFLVDPTGNGIESNGRRCWMAGRINSLAYKIK